MENKNKLDSLKSTLILIQQLQVKYFGKVNIDICMKNYKNCCFKVWVDNGEINLIQFDFDDSLSELENNYNLIKRLISDYINTK